MKKMHQFYNEENISLDALIDYVFKKLPVTAENAMEHFLDSHQEYAETVDGILDYCTDKNIKTKEGLVEDLRLNKAAFLNRFPQLESAEQASTNLPEKRNFPQKKISWFFLRILIFSVLLIGAALWYFTSPSKNNQIKEKIEKENRKEKDIITTVPSDKDDDINLVNPTEKTKNDIQKTNKKDSQNIQKNNPKTHTNLESVRKEIAAVFPLTEQANQQWNETFVVRGDKMLENLNNQLITKDSSQYALYGVGLYELTKENPNIDKAIMLLKKIHQREHPEALWFLFRAYLLSGDIEQAKVLYRKMSTNDSAGAYYQQNFFSSMSPSTIVFFQSLAN